MNNKNIELKKIVFEALGEASALFMSQEAKGTEIVMPTDELDRIGNEAVEKIVLATNHKAL